MLCRVSRAGERLEPLDLLSGPLCPIAKTSDLNNADCTHGADPWSLAPLSPVGQLSLPAPKMKSAAEDITAMYKEHKQNNFR